MADKATGKAQGRSRPQAQSKNRNQKGNPDAGRGNGASRGGRDEESNQRRMRSREQGQERQGDAEGQEQDQDQRSGAASAGSVGEKIKQHPITTAAIGAGLTLLAAQGLRMAIGGGNGGRGQAEDEGGQEGAEASGEQEEEGEEGEQQEEGEQGGGFTGRLGRIGSKLGSAFGGSGQAIKRGARSGFERGRQGAEQSWTSHPLVMCGVALAAGLAAGYLIPATSQEDRLMGEASDKVTGRIKKGGQAFFRQGRSIAGKVVHEAVNTTAESIEREGLGPDRLGKKVKKVFGNVREAVANAIEEE